MARTPSDATRFTATGPYVSQPAPTATSTSSQLHIGGSAPAGETPQQKIARLRAAAALAKRSKETSFDRTVRVGRVWADRAHRVTAVTLIGLTLVTGAVATAGITDMLMHNRRRRNEWLAAKQAETARDLAVARQAQAAGQTLTEEQVILLNRTRAAEEAALAKKNKPGVFKRASNWLYGGLAAEEQKGGKLGQSAVAAAATGISSSAEAVQSLSSSSPTLSNPVATAVSESKAALNTLSEKLDSARRQGEAAELSVRPAGGPLDQYAQHISDSAAQTTRGWTSWISGR